MEDKIQSEVKEIQKKLEDIEKKQEMLQKIQDLDRQHEQKMAHRPSRHVHGEMM
jgi:Skp family chaperone for outer membrane proteins